MNGRKAKGYRRMAEQNSIGKSIEFTRKLYRSLKRTKLIIASANPKPKKVRYKRVTTHHEGNMIKSYIPLAYVRYPYYKGEVKKGFVGVKGNRYHPTKGFRKSKDFLPKTELEYLAGNRTNLEQLIGNY